MDTRVRDWSTDHRATTLSARQLNQAFARVLGVIAAIWLVLFAAAHAFPFVENGAALVGKAKAEIATQPALFRPSDRMRLFAFGNSQIMSGIVPTQLDERLGQSRTFNLGLPGEERYVNLLQSALEAGNVPTTVLIQALPIKPEHVSLWDRFLDNKAMIGLVFPFKSFVRDLFVFAVEARGPGIVQQYRSNEGQIDTVRADRGFYFIKSQSHYPNDELPSDYSLPTDQPDKPARREFDRNNPEFRRLAALADRYDFKVVVIPTAFRTGAFSPPAAADPALTEALADFPRFSVVGPPYFLFPPRFFADPLHLNPVGAARYTDALAALLHDTAVAAK